MVYSIINIKGLGIHSFIVEKLILNLGSERTEVGSECTQFGSECTHLGSERTHLGSERTDKHFYTALIHI